MSTCADTVNLVQLPKKKKKEEEMGRLYKYCQLVGCVKGV